MTELLLEGCRSPLIERLLREAIADARKKAGILEATGWDKSMLPKVINGDAGILLKHLDSVFAALGLVVTTRDYMDYLAKGNVIGSNCACARASMGACGGK